jgi:hypothetical protein
MKRSMSYPTQLMLSNNVRPGSPVGQQGSHRRKSLFQKWNTIRVSDWLRRHPHNTYSCERAALS